MKSLLVCILFPLISFGQKTILCGTGILKIDVKKLPTINFYQDTLQNKIFKSVTVVKSNEDFTLKNKNEVSKWFKPEQIFLDYDVFLLRVDTVIGNWLKVYTDNEKQVRLWTKLENSKQYFVWDKFFKSEISNITPLDKNISIRQSNSENSQLIRKIEQGDCFEVLDIKRDWIKIRTHSVLDCSTSRRPIKIGWLKWKENNRLTIEFGMTD